jgi:multisubunit Na+/H+ antiporter MnhB subunit
MTVGLVVDVMLAFALVALSLRVVTGNALFRDIVLFILFGLLVALSWARLGAPDLALAEAAIGAGLTGALMLMAYRSIGSDTESAPVRRRPAVALVVAVLTGSLVAVIGLAALGIERVPGAAGDAVLEALPGTGLENAVTGVLLAFRGLDTMLEMAVLLVALLGAWTVLGDARPGRIHRVDRRTPLVGSLLTVVAPITLLVAVHLLLAGTDAPGGAFQAGAVLTGCGVLMVLTGTLRPAAVAGFATRVLVVAGLAAFVLIGAGAVFAGRAPMALPGTWAVYLIETAMMLSIALTMTLLFARARGLRGEGS